MEKKIILMAIRGDSYSARSAGKVFSTIGLTSFIDLSLSLFLFIFSHAFRNTVPKSHHVGNPCLQLRSNSWKLNFIIEKSWKVSCLHTASPRFTNLTFHHCFPTKGCRNMCYNVIFFYDVFFFPNVFRNTILKRKLFFPFFHPFLSSFITGDTQYE